MGRHAEGGVVDPYAYFGALESGQFDPPPTSCADCGGAWDGCATVGDDNLCAACFQALRLEDSVLRLRFYWGLLGGRVTREFQPAGGFAWADIAAHIKRCGG